MATRQRPDTRISFMFLRKEEKGRRQKTLKNYSFKNKRTCTNNITVPPIYGHTFAIYLAECDEFFFASLHTYTRKEVGGAPVGPFSWRASPERQRERTGFFFISCWLCDPLPGLSELTSIAKSFHPLGIQPLAHVEPNLKLQVDL